MLHIVLKDQTWCIMNVANTLSDWEWLEGLVDPEVAKVDMLLDNVQSMMKIIVKKLRCKISSTGRNSSLWQQWTKAFCVMSIVSYSLVYVFLATVPFAAFLWSTLIFDTGWLSLNGLEHGSCMSTNLWNVLWFLFRFFFMEGLIFVYLHWSPFWDFSLKA